MRAELAWERGIPAKRPGFVDGRREVAVEANAAAVQKGIAIIFIRLASEAKHVSLLHWQNRRCDLRICLENLAWVDVRKGAWAGTEGWHCF